MEHVTLFLRKEFQLETLPEHAWLQCKFDDGGNAWLNGQPVGDRADVARHLRVGENVFAVKLIQGRYAAGYLAELDLLFADGAAQKIITDNTWRFFPALDEIRRQWQVDKAFTPSGQDVSGFKAGWADAISRTINK